MILTPTLANVIDDGTYSDHELYVRNVGCPPGWPAVFPDDPCPSPGAATEVSLISGGSVRELYGFDSSTITMSGGGFSDWLNLYDSSTATLNAGEVTNLYAYDSSAVMLNGELAGVLYAYGSLELTRCRGYLITWERGVHDAEESTAVSAGVPEADGGAGACRAVTRQNDVDQMGP